MKTIFVHDNHEVLKRVVGCKQGTFPDWAFIDFAIADQGVGFLIGATQLGAHCHANTYREAVPQRAGGDLQAWDARV